MYKKNISCREVHVTGNSSTCATDLHLLSSNMS